ncbi:Zinc carboxypeptidase [Paramyrothecium foliicola]|nr:Zinc carboxypeptidase [Paramyrothecium foliicola]
MKFSSVVAALGLTSTVSACLLHSEREAERAYVRTGKRTVQGPRSVRRQTSTTIPIGTGDRFAGGCVTPVGLGVKERDLESVLSVKEVTSALRGLKKGYPDEVQLFTPPFKTVEGRELPGAVVGENPRVFIMSGIHARERGGPDNVIYFLADLLAAKKAGTGVTYGGKNYTAADVETALNAGIVVLPITNPDGVNYDQTTSTCWRKNRNPASSSSGDPASIDIGVDLNRNYDFVWDYKKAFNLEAADSPASDDPSSEVFYGTEPASEAETKAVVWTLDQYQNITWFMDLHSFTGSILYAWGDDDTGTEAPEQNFVNPDFDGKRGFVGEDPPDSIYKEYFTASDLKIEEDGTSAMVNSMIAAGGVQYNAYPAVGLYPTSGASNDYAMGRYYGQIACGASRMFGLTLEFGVESTSDPSCPFYPDNGEYHRNVRQVGAGFMEMMLVAAGPSGDPLILEC